jgi:dTDP-4-amino-4,6-dideoxygalactose transaminase
VILERTLVIKVPFFDLRRQYSTLREEILTELHDVCESQAFVLGPKVSEFEGAIERLCEAGHAVGASSGTDAELLILMTLGIGPGDAVVTTPFTFLATAGCVARLGAELCFVDIDRATYNLDPIKLREFLERDCRVIDGVLRTRRNSQVKAIVPVHLFGLCAAMAEINVIAKQYGIAVIEDAAQAIGAVYPSPAGARRAGTIADWAFFSFYPTKNLGAFGDAGLALARELAAAERMKALRNHGMRTRYHHEWIGGNFRLDAIQAAILLMKLPFLPGWSRRRWEIAQRYKELLADLYPRVILPVEPYAEQVGSEGHTYHQYVVRAERRDALREALSSRGVGTEVYYPVPLHAQQCFSALGYGEGDFPQAEQAAGEVLALPIFPELTDSEVEFVAESIGSFYRNV